MCLLLVSFSSRGNGYLHTQGRNIVDGDGKNVILRGIGTGNWMLMEGYMMNTSGVANTQHEFRAKLIETIGVAKTDSFFNAWLKNHFTRTDVDSMKAWGFNSIRVAMHYKWFTLPSEDEPIAGENTWLQKGFVMIDSLLDWCADNQMYLILDLHGAPGGQGKDEAISDYDPSKPSLWESDANKNKTIALWQKLAQRYASEPWIGGYDLLNETNWTFPEGNNSQMRKLFTDITNVIREVDTNHIIFIEGNSFANDHSGLTPPWDNNMVYSFHKYWSGTGANDLDWILALRNAYNVPIWLGESGENSNTWYTDLIRLCETNNVGWSWWPVKKNGLNNVLSVNLNKSYDDLIKYWKGEISTAPTVDEAFQAVLQWAENHKIENCNVQYDVIDAMMRQPFTNDVKPYKKHLISQEIFFSDYDYGKNGIAYWDKYVANYGGEWTGWNNGWMLRSDGVDIEVCNDTNAPSNGYNVGWTDDGEWMQYSLSVDSLASYNLNVRHASGGSGSKVHLEVNGTDVSGSLTLPATGGWQTWKTAVFPNIIIPSGDVKLKFVFDRGGSNVNFFHLTDPKSVDDINFHFVSAETSEDGLRVFVHVNKAITTPSADLLVSDFDLLVDGVSHSIATIAVNESATQILELSIPDGLFSDNTIALSYNGSSIKSGTQNLQAFSGQTVAKNMAASLRVPGKIQAEAFYVNRGLELEDCSDVGEGQNTGYANPGDYLEYKIHATKTGYYKIIYRVATEKTNAQLVFQVGNGVTFSSKDTITFTNTGGWQKWENQFSDVYLVAGYYNIRLYVKQGEHNLNWFQLNYTGTPVKNVSSGELFKIYPNPAHQNVTFNFNVNSANAKTIDIYSVNGQLVKSIQSLENKVDMDVSNFSSGFYLVHFNSGKQYQCVKLSIK